MPRIKTPECWVNQARDGSGFLHKKNGMRLTVRRPLEADKYLTKSEAAAAGEHFGRQYYDIRSYSAVAYINEEDYNA